MILELVKQKEDKLNSAKVLLIESLGIIEKIFGQDHPKYYTVRNTMIKWNMV